MTDNPVVSHEDLSAGTVLSSLYRVGLVVGRGGMGAVYDGVRIADNLRVAIKVLSEHAKADPSAIARFEREAIAASRLGHPNIVRVFDFRRPSNEPPYLVMELIEGHSLGDEIEAMGALDTKRVALIAEEALSALSAAHKASIIHRDIKPDNIVLLRDPVHVQTKLVDFGVAKVAGAQQLTQAGQIVGTPAYMAPEQWHARAVDERTDFYALGGCLYHALIGRPAISSAVEALEPGFAEARAREMPKVRPDIPEELALAIAKALSDEPRNRYSSAEEMAAAIGKAMPHSTAAMPTHRPTTMSSMAATVAAPTPTPMSMQRPTPMPAPLQTPMPPPIQPGQPPRTHPPSWNAPPTAPPGSTPMRGSMPMQTFGPIPRAPMSTAVKSLLIAGAILVALGYMLRDTCLGVISRATAPKK